ncbi:MAG: DegV family EDD domain-containing protein, partial [Clostridia bacterium]|nr:DegV family EDD domain-containing protein [Clostridia bacterium]
GATDEEIVKFVEENINNYALYFTVKDLTQLKRGGRLSAVSFVAGTLLNIKPIIHVDEEGALNKCETVKGVKAGLRTLADKVKLLGDDVYNHMIIIAHADAPDFAQEIKAQLIHQFGENLNIFVQYIGPTVAAHCGAGAVGIAFHSKSR